MLYVASGLQSLLTAYTESDIFGKSIFISLFILSIISWVILVNKTIVTRAVRRASQQINHSFNTQKQTPLNVELRKHSFKEIPNPFYELYHVLKQWTVEILNKNRWFAEKAVQAPQQEVYLSQSDIDLINTQLFITISQHVKKLERNLFLLPTVVSLAPFLGLLGTVWGILITFSGLQSSTAGNNQAVLAGLSMALATTILGLVVAIPALIAYNYIKYSIRQYETEMECFSYTMLTAVEIQYRKVDAHE